VKLTDRIQQDSDFDQQGSKNGRGATEALRAWILPDFDPESRTGHADHISKRPFGDYRQKTKYTRRRTPDADAKRFAHGTSENSKYRLRAEECVVSVSEQHSSLQCASAL